VELVERMERVELVGRMELVELVGRMELVELVGQVSTLWVLLDKFQVPTGLIILGLGGTSPGIF